MKQKLFTPQLFLGFAITLSAFAQSPVGAKWRDAKPNIVTLFARHVAPPDLSKDTYESPPPGYGKSAFSFRFGIRSDAGTAKTRNNYELQYGGLNWNGDVDFFNVTMVVDDCSRIKDLGELQWSDIVEVPLLPASLTPGRAKRFSPREAIEESTEGQMTRVVAGHVYVLHSKDRETDFYTLFRVENLLPGQEVTISWKVVPSPEGRK